MAATFSQRVLAAAIVCLVLLAALGGVAVYVVKPMVLAKRRARDAALASGTPLLQQADQIVHACGVVTADAATVTARVNELSAYGVTSAQGTTALPGGWTAKHPGDTSSFGAMFISPQGNPAFEFGSSTAVYGTAVANSMQTRRNNTGTTIYNAQGNGIGSLDVIVPPPTTSNGSSLVFKA
jgi:hypothetical protein